MKNTGVSEQIILTNPSNIVKYVETHFLEVTIPKLQNFETTVADAKALAPSPLVVSPLSE